MVTREQYAECGELSGLPYEVGVYTQGKVGSKAVLAAMREMFDGDLEAGENMYVWDYRRSDPQGVLEHQKVQGTRKRLLSDDPEIAQFLVDNPSRDLRLTTVVREPVAINLSSFFYNFAAKNPGTDIRGVSDDEIVERLVAGESFSHPTFHLDWFDIEVEPMTGIDVYKGKPIPENFTSQMPRTYTGEVGDRHTDLLMIRLEDISEVGALALHDFYKRPLVEIGKVNSADELVYSERYKEFKRDAQLPADWVSSQLNSQYASHFYNLGERARFAEKWTGDASLAQ